MYLKIKHCSVILMQAYAAKKQENVVLVILKKCGINIVFRRHLPQTPRYKTFPAKFWNAPQISENELQMGENTAHTEKMHNINIAYFSAAVLHYLIKTTL